MPENYRATLDEQLKVLVKQLNEDEQVQKRTLNRLNGRVDEWIRDSAQIANVANEASRKRIREGLHEQLMSDIHRIAEDAFMANIAIGLTFEEVVERKRSQRMGKFLAPLRGSRRKSRNRDRDGGRER